MLMLVDWRIFQSTANFNPAAAAKLLEHGYEAIYALAGPEVLPVAVAARMLPHCVERYPELAGGGFLADDRAQAMLRCATGQLETPGHSALSPGEAARVFASLDPQRIAAWRPAGPVPADDQQRLDDILSEACRSNVPQAIGALVAAGARLQVDERGETAAHAAARAGHERVMPALLASGIPLPEMMRRNRQGDTPVIEAVRNGHVHVIRALLGAGVDEQTVMSLQQDGNTLAHRAALNGQPDWIQTLRAGGISPEGLMARDNQASTPAHYAAERGNVDVIRALLAVGVPADALMARDDQGRTPAHYAADERKTDVIRALLEAGVSPRALMRSDANGHTPAANAAPETLRAMRDLGIPGYLLVVPQLPSRRAGPELTP
jgi:ankyrin repeat protein